MEFSVDVKGLKELNARLEELEAVTAARATKRALYYAARPMAETAGQILRSKTDGSGALASAVRVLSVRSPDGDKAIAAVKVAPASRDKTAIFTHNAFYQRKKRGVFYGHLLEFGHRIGTRASGRLKRVSRALTERGLALWQVRNRGGRIKGAESGGRVLARPFLDPAFTSNYRGMLDRFGDRLARNIDLIARRKGQKTADKEIGVKK